MRKQEVLQFLEAHKQELMERFGVKHLALFGSTVRDEAVEGSDVDVLVEFEGGETYRNYFDLLFFWKTICIPRWIWYAPMRFARN